MQEGDDYFHECKRFFTTNFVPEREKVIKDLRILKNEIQEVTRFQKSCSVVLCSLGLIGWFATGIGFIKSPLTKGGFLTTLGLALRMVSEILFFFHEDNRIRNVDFKIDYAMRCLKCHDRKCVTTNTYLRPIRREIKSLQDEIKAVQQTKDCNVTKLKTHKQYVVENFPFLFKILVMVKGTKMLDILRHIPTGDTDHKTTDVKKAMEDVVSMTGGASLLYVTIFGISVLTFGFQDIMRIKKELNMLSDFKKDRLCPEACSLEGIINSIENELMICRKWF